MRYNEAVRNVLRDFMAANGGRATIKELRDAAAAAGHAFKPRTFHNYVEALVDDGTFIRLGRGAYALSDARLATLDRVFVTPPYGTRLEAAAARLLLRSRAVRVRDAVPALRKEGRVAHPTAVTEAFTRLAADGYALRAAFGTYVATMKLLRAVGLPDVLDDTPPERVPLGLIIQPHVLDIVAAGPPARQRDVTRALKARGFPVKDWHAVQALRRLCRDGQVKKHVLPDDPAHPRYVRAPLAGKAGTGPRGTTEGAAHA